MIDSTSALLISSSRRSEVVLRAELSPAMRDEMFALFASYFENADRAVFERDLEEKEWVVVLRDDDGVIDGFSTLMRIDVDQAATEAGGGLQPTADCRLPTRRKAIFYSGDTIVARHRWGSMDLPRMWSRHVFALAAQIEIDSYWFLISSGFRTYRYLPLFFRTFDPAPNRVTPPDVKSLIDAIATRKFGDAYDASTGIIRLATPAPLRSGISDPSQRIDRDPHVRFFVESNQHHAAGDELACLVRIAVDNLTPAGRRMVGLK